ncbi:OmpA family protein [Sansalvadorimonas sp. 2012CJ34-2]|uniref:OmpA family protein n=1 Tax=Parendozoicomonas callyspongiae TaxID=2942213 RepID=A0ABT0PKB0_9GAMM|nr:OmpA family protein [Sansalvadorimonas sp. 2012CJ34-2]MCL6271681.1 OmpA family protein [Sansalvadorimonas sp. 2012CJ34-2]
MAEYDGLKPGQILADASVAEFIKNLGLGIAEAQKALDDNSVQQIAEFIEPIEGLGGKTLLDLGLSPAFYHYQYADLKCSMQLSLRVQKDLSLGLNIGGSYKSDSSDSSNESASETYKESGSKKSTQTRKASVEITSASAGALVVNGKNFQLSGSSPAERIESLQDALVGDKESGIDRVLYQLKPSTIAINSTADPKHVTVNGNTIAFHGGESNAGIIRISTNGDTEYVLNSSPDIKVQTSAKGDLATYATHVASAITAKNYNVDHIAEGGAFKPVMFEIGKHTISSSQQDYLQVLAYVISKLGFSVDIEGFADTQQYADKSASDQLNKDLGNNRAIEVFSILRSFGVNDSKLNVIESKGDQAARGAGDSPGTDNPVHRKVEIRKSGHTGHWLLVRAKNGGPGLDSVAPNKVGDSSADNGFIYLFDKRALQLENKAVTIDGHTYPYRGDAAGGFTVKSAPAYAKNLADDINSDTNSGLKASARRNIVTVSKNGDKFALTLVTNSSRNIRLDSTEGVTISSQFTLSKTSNMTKQSKGNRSVAVGATVDARYSRQFEMNVTGNSSIAARLVSIPAPPQFLETIKEFLDNEG